VGRWLRRILVLVVLACLGLAATGCGSELQPVAVQQTSDADLKIYYRHCRFESDPALSVSEADALTRSDETVVWQGTVPVKSEPFSVPVPLKTGKTYAIRKIGSDDVLNSFSADSLQVPAGLVTYPHLGTTVNTPVSQWATIADNWCLNASIPVVAGAVGVAVVVLAVAGAIAVLVLTRRRRKRLRKAFAGAKGDPVGVLWSRRPSGSEPKP
jgi:hypothetical protein